MNNIDKLIDRLLDDSLAPGESLSKGVSYDSSKTVSWLAQKEIDHLSQLDIETIKKIISEEKIEERRKEAFHILIKLSEKYNDPESVYFILDHLKLEKKKSFVGLRLFSLSISIYGIKLSDRLDIVLNFAKSKDSAISNPALQLLSNYTIRQEEIEAFLLDVIQSNANEYKLSYASTSLGHVGSHKSIEPLKKLLLENTKSDVLTSGIFALGSLDKKNQLDFFINLLSLKKDSFVKASIVHQLVNYDFDLKLIESLIARAKSILAKERKTNMGYVGEAKPEIVEILSYLLKFKNNDQKIPDLFQWVLDKKIDFLDETEKAWVKENLG